MLPFYCRVWVLLVGILQTGNGLNHHTRHERTRYVSGKNQIYASGYSLVHDADNVPFVNFWERPLQELENAMNVAPRKLSSRPLFSWDIPEDATTETIATATPEDSVEEGMTASTTTTTTTTATTSASIPPIKEIYRLIHFSKGASEKRLDRKHRAKDSDVFHTTHEFTPSPLRKKKKKSANRKKSVDDYDVDVTKRRDKHKTRDASVEREMKRKRRQRGKKKLWRANAESGKVLKPTKETNEVHVGHFHRVPIPVVGITARSKANLDGITGVGQQTKPTKSVCDTTEMKCEHRCQEVNGTAVCLCHKGFRPVGTKCLDVNECETNNGGCNGRCVNTIGSRKCFCHPGYRLNEGVCMDVNECLLRNGHGPCQDRCTNTEGGYRCSCENFPGTVLSSDQHTCRDPRECDAKSAGCSHSCVSVSAMTFCVCPDGMELGSDWKTCQDIDECSNPDDHNVNCTHGCINTIGSYRCSSENETGTGFS